MNNYNYKKYFSFFIALGVAYLLSGFSINNLFLAQSPSIRPNLDQYFLAKINNTKESILAKLRFNFTLPSFNLALNNTDTNSSSNSNWFQNNNSNSVSNREEKMNFLKSTLKPITKGVSAASKDGYNYMEFKINEIEWIKVTYTLKNGKVITIQYPKGTNPPPKAIYE